LQFASDDFPMRERFFPWSYHGTRRYDIVRTQFSEEEIKTLTLAVAMINVWNRFNVALRTVPATTDISLGIPR
jgi:hypothetical protein